MGVVNFSELPLPKPFGVCDTLVVELIDGAILKVPYFDNNAALQWLEGLDDVAYFYVEEFKQND